MAIISGARTEKKEKLKIEINAEILADIKSYCEWANIDDISYFIEEAACFIFSKDKGWKQQQKANNRTNQTK
ncbi:MAG: hypothetical protein K2X39_04980 [Silvanigrellaceae bacterium]|nr:hypothetical protein [Silvanigrellaceae bacterium]